MAEFVTISKHTGQLMKELCSKTDDVTLQVWCDSSTNELHRVELVAWLSQPVTQNKNMQLLLESLRASLLEDLHDSLVSVDELSEKRESRSLGWFNNMQFHLLIIAGALLAVCGGYSGITAILGTFAVPAAIVTGVGVIFAGISLAFFYHFDRVEMSKIFGAKLKQPRQLLDVCVSQVEQIKQLRKVIDDCYTKTVDLCELKALHDMVKMLSCRYEDLGSVRQAYAIKLNNPYINAVKLATAMIEGGLVLAGGFFAGQSISLAVASLFVASVSVTFWPIFVAGAVLSLAALSVYCVMERPGYEGRVGLLLGIDKTKIETFSSSHIVNKQMKKLQNLEHKIEEKLDSLQHIEQLHKQIEGCELVAKRMESVSRYNDSEAHMVQKPKVTSPHRFFKRSLSLNDVVWDRVQQNDFSSISNVS